MSDKPTPSAWKRFGRPAVVIIAAIIWGMVDQPGHEDWSILFTDYMIYPVLLLMMAVGAAVFADKKLGRFCMLSLLFLIVSGMTKYLVMFHIV